MLAKIFTLRNRAIMLFLVSLYLGSYMAFELFWSSWMFIPSFITFVVGTVAGFVMFLSSFDK